MLAARGFIFDMDGTLLSLPVAWPELRAKLAKQAGMAEFQPVFQTMVDVLKQRPSLKAELFATLDEYEEKAEPSARLHEGAKEVVELLAKRATLALVTMQGSSVRGTLLGRFGLASNFRALFSREDSLDRREQLEMAIRSLSLRRDDVTFVGDRINDLNAARRTGLEFVFIRDMEDATGAKLAFPDMKAFLQYLTERKG